MRTYNNLWEKLVSWENIRKAVDKACKGKSRQRQIRAVKKDPDKYARMTQELLVSGKFTTSKYQRFRQHYPKERWIYILPAYPDRIVHHALVQVLKEPFMDMFIKDTYSAIPGRGQTQASARCAEFTRRFECCLDSDIRRYHESMRPELLSMALRKYIKDEKVAALADDIIFSFPWCPTGNYTSQWWTNLYLHAFDMYVKHTLRCKGYVRYADNFLLFGTREQCEEWKKLVWPFLAGWMLEPSHSVVRNCWQGVYFVGYRHFKKFVLLRRRTARHQTRYMARVKNKKYDSVQSMLAWDKHACSYNFRKKSGLDALGEELKYASVA